jgi:peptidoglycan/xylan/chitin deacetylase (PgdA/CDA1 family)
MKAILTYHAVDDSGSPISVPPHAFAHHVRWLSSGRVKVLRLDDLLAYPDSEECAVAITFDDAFSNARSAAEQLLSAGLPVTIFAVSRHVGQTNAWNGNAEAGIPTAPLMAWKDLEDLMARGAEIAPHTRRHCRLTSLSTDALDDEIGGSLEDLRRHLGTASPHFAYPYGDLDDRVAGHVGRFFRWGHTTDFRPIRASENPLRVPRLDMYYFGGPGDLESCGTPRFARRLAFIRARRWVRARVIG